MLQNSDPFREYIETLVGRGQTRVVFDSRLGISEGWRDLVHFDDVQLEDIYH
jgi:hypothetical protein